MAVGSQITIRRVENGYTLDVYHSNAPRLSNRHETTYVFETFKDAMTQAKVELGYEPPRPDGDAT